MGFTGLHQGDGKVIYFLFLSSGSREKSMPWLFQFLGAPHIPWLMILSSNFKSRNGIRFLLVSHRSDIDFSAFLFHTEEL